MSIVGEEHVGFRIGHFVDTNAPPIVPGTAIIETNAARRALYS